jgi:hypothetical protein
VGGRTAGYRGWTMGMSSHLDSPGLGLGLPIIASTTDGFTVAPCEGGGTELRMRFDLASA